MVNTTMVKKRKAIVLGIAALVLAVFGPLAGCGAGTEEIATPEVTVDYVPIVSVTGEVLPAAWATLSAQNTGTVLEVAVEPGDAVAAGDLLIQLDPADAQLAVRRAEARLESARAQLALLQASPRSEEVAAAEAQVEAAEAVLSQATARRDQLRAGTTAAEIAAARAQVTAAQAEQLAAYETHEDTMECFNVTMPDGNKKKICPLLGPVEEQARYNLQVADERLDAARAQLDALIQGEGNRLRVSDAAALAAAEERDIAQAQLDLLRAGATSEEIAAAEASVRQNEAALAAAQVALERTEIRAPFDTTVGLIQVREGEYVAPEQSLLTVGDLSTLRVETTDLDEIDVARVAVGQKVDVTFDALPERVFTGHVTRISPMAGPGGGGVNYTVIIELDEVDSRILWGMTAFVDIDVQG